MGQVVSEFGSGSYCTAPFTTLKVIMRPSQVKGKVLLSSIPCCEPWLNGLTYKDFTVYADVGALCDSNYIQVKLDELFNTSGYKKLRDSIRLGSYAYCSRSCTIDRSHFELAPLSIDSGQFTRYADMIRVGCNCRCMHCSVPSMVNTTTGLNISDHLYNKALENIDWLYTGLEGEPLINKVVLNLFQNGLRQPSRIKTIFCTTNAINMTPKMISTWDTTFFKKIAATFSISLDAACESTFYRIKDSSSYNLVLSNIQALQEWGLHKFIRISFIISTVSFNDLYVLPELMQYLGIGSVSFYEYNNMRGDNSYIKYNVLHEKHSERNKAIKALLHFINKADKLGIAYELPQIRGVNA